MKVSVRKVVFNEDDMARDDDFLSNEINTSISMMIKRITQVDIRRGT